MTTLDRVRVTYTGMPGGPGVSTFYSLDGPSILTPLHTLFTALATSMPQDVSIGIPGVGDRIDAASGDLTGQWTGVDPGQINASNASGYAAAIGMLLRWETGVIQDGHHIRGRTFIVPISGGAFGQDGQVLPATHSVFATAAAAFVIAAQPFLVVWHRPFAGSAATATRPARAAHVGAASLVTTSSVSSSGVVLRSRRD